MWVTRKDAFDFCADEMDRLGVLMKALGVENPAGCGPEEIQAQLKLASSRHEVSEVWLLTVKEALERTFRARNNLAWNLVKMQAHCVVRGIMEVLDLSDSLPPG